MWNNQLFVRVATALGVLLLSSGSLVLALNPANQAGVLPAPVQQPVILNPEVQNAPVQDAPVLNGAVPNAAVQSGVVPESVTQLAAPAAAISEVAPSQRAVDQRQLRGIDYQRDWRQVGSDNQNLGTATRKYAVHLGVDGSLHGRISLINPAGDVIPVSNLPVDLVSPDGLVSDVAITGPTGDFVFQHLHPGVVGLIAQGPQGTNALVAFGLVLLPAKAGNAPEVLQLQLNSDAIPPSDIGLAKHLIDARVPHGVHGLHWSEPTDAQIPAGAAANGNDADVNAVLGSALTQNQIRLQPDGSLIGRVRVLHPVTGRPLRARGMSAVLIQNGSPVADIPVRPNGTFAFEGLPPGVYSFVTAGLDGFAVFSIDVLPPVNAVATGSRIGSTYMPVALLKAEATELDVAVCYSTALNTLLQTFPVPPFGGAPNPGFGGGGGGVGGGGSGGLLAGLAAGIAAGLAAADDDNNPLPATPVLP